MKYDAWNPDDELEAAAQANYESRIYGQLGARWQEQAKAWARLDRQTRHEYYMAAATVLNTRAAADGAKMAKARAAKAA